MHDSVTRITLSTAPLPWLPEYESGVFFSATVSVDHAERTFAFDTRIPMNSNSTAPRRSYRRRSDDERIAELENRIKDLKARQAVRDKKDDPVIREIPKIQRRLRKFAQLAMNHQRPDIANSITAFTAGLERVVQSELGAQPAPPGWDADE